MFKLIADSGVEITANAQTLTGAKREATKWMTFGGGSVSVANSKGNILCTRYFWRIGNHFGWDKWVDAN